MTARDKVRISDRETFLVWLESGRRLARNALKAAGASEELIEAIEALPNDLKAFGSIVGIKHGESFTVTDEVRAAILMLRECDLIEAETVDPQVPAYRHVLSGCHLIEMREAMLAQHWLAQEKRERNCEIGKLGGRPPTMPRRFVSMLKNSGTTWEALDEQMPVRHDQPSELGGYLVTLEHDGRFLLTDIGSGETAKPVKRATLRDLFNK